MTKIQSQTAVDTAIDNDVLSLPVSGRGLTSRRFEEVLTPSGTLLVFLRHLGCTFCRQMVDEIKNAKNALPPVVFVHQGGVKEGEEFFSQRWPEAIAIADPDLKLYRAFEVGRGGFMQLFGPETLVCGLRGLAQGHGVGLPMGDPLLMPGLFFIRDGHIVWSHEFRHAGDHPDFNLLSTTALP